MNITDKVLFTQGNASTYVSGTDGRLIYNGIDGEDKKYLLEGEIEIPSGEVTPTEDVQDIFNNDGFYLESDQNGSDSDYEFGARVVKRKIGLRSYEDEDHNLVIACELTYWWTTTEGEEIGNPHTITIWKSWVDINGAPHFKIENNEENESQE